MENDFDRWNEIKKRLARNASPPPAFPKTGEVWMCTLGKNLAREQDGGARDFSRPVLVIKKLPPRENLWAEWPGNAIVQP